MKWLKTTLTAASAAILAFLAIFAVASAKRHRETADKWRDKAVDIETGNVVKGVATAKQATSQAKLHDQRADSIKKKAEARITQIADKDEDVSDIIKRWGQ